MRTRASLAAVVAACAWAAAAHAGGGGPGAVYSDFAEDGVLSCNHARADLESVLRSGTLNQYGDPLTLAKLKLAVRKQLAIRFVRHPNEHDEQREEAKGKRPAIVQASARDSREPRRSRIETDER